MTATGPIALAVEVAKILDAVGIDHVIGGSLASSVVGEPRSTVDIDVAVRMDEALLTDLTEALHESFYVPTDAARLAVREHSSFNVLHTGSGFKVDLFVLGDDVLDRLQLDRRTSIVVSDDPPERLWITSPEDQVLRKLDWYRKGGHTSDRQWRDVRGILEAQAGHLDDRYLDETARATGLSDLLAAAREQST